mgnify:CR=1 FL=1
MDADKKRMGYLSFQNGKWMLVNENLPDLKDLTEDKDIAIDEFVELTEGKKLLLSKKDSGRFALISITNKN